MGTNASYTRQCSGGGIGGELKQTLKTLQGIAQTGGAFFAIDIMQ
jgi:hypothetical protein